MLATCITIFALIAAINAHPVVAAPTLQVSGITLTGASNIIVEGKPYNVTFSDGTCLELFNGCNSVADFTFTTASSAVAAAQALLDTVLLDVSEGGFDSRPWQTAGCSSTSFCAVVIPYTLSSPFVLVAVAENQPVIIDPAAGLSQDFPNDDYRNFVTHTWAVFTPVANVPEPASSLLLGASLVGLAAARRRRGSQRT